MPIDNPLVPLATVALELGEDLAQLAARLDGAVIEDAIGLRCVSRETAAAVIAEHHSSQQVKREMEQQRRAAHQAVIRELQARNRARVRGGIPAQSGSAFADMLAVDQR